MKTIDKSKQAHVEVNESFLPIKLANELQSFTGQTIINILRVLSFNFSVL